MDALVHRAMVWFWKSHYSVTLLILVSIGNGSSTVFQTMGLGIPLLAYRFWGWVLKKKCDQKINNFHTFFGPNLHTHLIYHSRTWKENTHPHAYRGWTIPDSLFWGTYTQLLPRGGIRWTADHDYFWGFDSPSYRSKLRAVVVVFFFVALCSSVWVNGLLWYSGRYNDILKVTPTRSQPKGLE